MDRDSGQEYNACGKRDMTNFVERMGESTEVFVGKRDKKLRHGSPRAIVKLLEDKDFHLCSTVKEPGLTSG